MTGSFSLPAQELVSRSEFSSDAAGQLHNSPQYRALLDRHIQASGIYITCMSCGWTAKKADYQEFVERTNVVVDRSGVDHDAIGIFSLHHLSHRHNDFDDQNLALTCKPCHAAHHLYLGGGIGTGEVLLFKALSQIQILHLWRSVATLDSSSHPWSQHTRTVYQDVLRMARAATAEAFGMGGAPEMLSPAHLRIWLMRLDGPTFVNAQGVLSDLRLFPLNADFPAFIRFVSQYQSPTQAILSDAGSFIDSF